MSPKTVSLLSKFGVSTLDIEQVVERMELYKNESPFIKVHYLEAPHGTVVYVDLCIAAPLADSLSVVYKWGFDV